MLKKTKVNGLKWFLFLFPSAAGIKDKTKEFLQKVKSNLGAKLPWSSLLLVEKL